MNDRVMYVQLKTGYNTDAGPSWIGWVRFTKTWRTAYFRGRTLRRVTGTAHANFDANFYDTETGEKCDPGQLDRTRGVLPLRHPPPALTLTTLGAQR